MGISLSSALQNLSDFKSGKFWFTPEGGIAIKKINKTGAPSVKGTLVDESSTTDNGFKVTEANSNDVIGVVYEDGIADGDECYMVISGRCQVLLKDTTAATREFWAKTSDVAGRADITSAVPPGGGVVALDEHFQEIGHGDQSIGSGVDVLAFIQLHLN